MAITKGIFTPKQRIATQSTKPLTFTGQVTQSLTTPSETCEEKSVEGRTISRSEANSILARQESHFWDFKSSRSDGPTVQKISSAFANAEGGEFIVGIEDAKTGSRIDRWQGFKTIEDANWVQQSLVDQADPPAPYDIEYLRVSGFEESGWACLVTVQKSPDVHTRQRKATSISVAAARMLVFVVRRSRTCHFLRGPDPTKTNRSKTTT
ncbi:ATP-binding protein [Streptomyces sp. NPDC012389]|uniref:ATP-binding protein n=1 Tax=Streptomyces sp. NPDC012389 TaxID=3364830 RepID=UPI0036E28987